MKLHIFKKDDRVEIDAGAWIAVGTWVSYCGLEFDALNHPMRPDCIIHRAKTALNLKELNQ